MCIGLLVFVEDADELGFWRTFPEKSLVVAIGRGR